ncbi:uncharacterized protein LOC129764720 isoform X2 [Toxorhynchites rutilus septentrionalis]|uniref:uncharacterized protein LOC129764720 isoform X2 n=1 Tax=Toxorhynchites rutilus septentrionalis TaxID=329112 RepID=UPI00247A09F9|nr:uncharacterized protein LOC129764720 isoform X2 [Toxorhynchites rutilus septentrionalis]
MSEQIEQISLPPGWDCKYDPRTGRYYYVNLFTKMTTWEDPRARIRQIQTGAPLHISNDNVAVQPVHGSPYHVYPSSNSFYPAQQAFQNPPSGVPSLTASPNLATKLQQQIELSPMLRSSPHTPRMGLGRQAMQETSFSNNCSAADTDATVAKINSMFPTVPETHIRMLLKKYYNREAVVISALQVEKHPLTTPGPYSTPPLTQRHFHNTAMGVVSAFQMTPVLGGRSEVSTSRTGSPIARPASCASGSYYGGYQHGSSRSNGIDMRHNSPKPHSSPKMKLRYLKSFFPKAEETLILDILANADNNVQTASQQLIKLGYEKREQLPTQRGSFRKDSEKEQQSGDVNRSDTPTPPAKPKTQDEKKKIKTRLQAKYKDIAERIIMMALESVDYSEDRAKQILNIVIQEDREKKKSVKIDAPLKPDEDKENAQASSVTPSHSNGTSAAHLRPKKGSVDSDNPTGQETDAGSSDQQDETTADNDNDASIEITNSTNSTAIIKDSPQSPPSLSQQHESRDHQHHQQQQQQQGGRTELSKNSTIATAAASSLKQCRVRAKSDHAKGSSSEDELDGPGAAASSKSDKLNFSTPRIVTMGPNAKIFRGPNDDLLLADYVTWNGANPDLAKGSQKLAKGPDRSIRIERTYKVHGPNSELCKGPSGLAKGSVYGQLKCSAMNDVKCN